MITQWKEKPIRDKRYRLFVASQPCVVCGVESVAHHEQETGKGIMGGKCCDTRCVPLCVWHHNERHNSGRLFWPYWELDPEKIITDLREKYLTPAE